jgi:alpha-1,6-mannosyltransferase
MVGVDQRRCARARHRGLPGCRPGFAGPPTALVRLLLSAVVVMLPTPSSAARLLVHRWLDRYRRWFDRWSASTGRVRIVGVVGCVVMAASAWILGPASDHRPLTQAPGRWPGIVGWLIGVLVLAAAWWGAGGLARTGAVSRRWLVVTTALWSLPLLAAPPMASRDVYGYACQGQVYAAGLDPYQVGPAALPCTWLAAVPPIWRGTPAPYGPLGILVSAAAATVSAGHLVLAVLALRLPALVGLALLAWYLPRLADLGRVAAVEALWLGLASPLVLIHVVSGAHHDGLMLGLLVAGLAYAARGGALRAAAGLALAAAVKVSVVIALPFALVLLLRAATGWRARLRAGLVFGVGTLAVFAALSAVSGLGLGWRRALPGPHSIVHWLSPASGVGLAVGGVVSLFDEPEAITDSVVGFRVAAMYVLLPVLVVMLWWRARTGSGRPALNSTGWALTAAAALSPLSYPWYAVTPVAVLAASSRGRTVTVIGVTGVALSLVILPDSTNLAIVTRWPGSFAVLVAVVVLGVLGARSRWRAGWRLPFIPRRRRARGASSSSRSANGSVLLHIDDRRSRELRR